MRVIVSQDPFMYGIVAVITFEELGLLTFSPVYELRFTKSVI